MTIRTAVLAATAGVVLLAAALTIGGPNRQESPGSTPPATSIVRHSQPGPPNADLLLPLSPEEISRAAQLARAFVAAYGTYRYDETPDAYTRRLTPMTDRALRLLITQSANNRALLAQRRRGHVVSTGDAQLDGIRALTAGSIIFLLTGVEHVTTDGKHSDQTARYAVTVTDSDTQTGTDDWTVTAIELASIGDTADGP
jgi:hypothetical protein